MLSFMAWFNTYSFICLITALILNIIVANFWHQGFRLKLGFNKKYKAVQRIHLNEIPRFGGLIFITSLALFSYYSEPNVEILLLRFILICLIPIFFIGLAEDTFNNINPVIRLTSIIIAAWYFQAEYQGPIPNLIDEPFLGKLFSLKGGAIFFYILSITAIANGMNLVDGVHGLCVSVALAILGSVLFLSFSTGDTLMVSLIPIVMIFLLPFLFVNYPSGRIFLGDLGSYALGFIVSLLIIIFFGRHPEISPWAGVLILIYPITEVVFSLLRRLIKGDSIFKPDKDHLHFRLFYFFRAKKTFKKIANPIVMPLLSALWLFPFIASCLFFQKLQYIQVAIVLFIASYVLFYSCFPRTKNRQLKRLY
jgi:UDP-GlcNAc:undecaprenyl-phosphate GlcNAc-1-phosphate transferase